MFDLGFLVEPGIFLLGMGIACFLLFRVNQVSFLYPCLFFRMCETPLAICFWYLRFEIFLNTLKIHSPPFIKVETDATLS